MALLYDHINLAYVQPDVAPAANRTWIAQTAKWMSNSNASVDYTEILAGGCKVYTYVSGNSFYRLDQPYGTTGGYRLWGYVKAFLAANPTMVKENLYWHYADDISFTTGTRSTSTLCAGYGLGVIPGYRSGGPVAGSSATALPHSRMISTQWPATGGPSSYYNPTGSIYYPPYRNNISAISRAAGIVTVTTSKVAAAAFDAHKYSVGDRVEIRDVPVGTNGLAFNGDFDVLDAVTTTEDTTFTYSDSRGDDTSSGGTCTYPYWISFSLNVMNDEWVKFNAYDFSRILVDSVGNKLHGLFFDSMLGQMIFANGHFFNSCKELQDNPNGITIPHADYPNASGTAAEQYAQVWVGEQLGSFHDRIKTETNTWRGDSQAVVCGNGDGFPYALRYSMYDWHTKYSDYILLEGGMAPRFAFVYGQTSYETYWQRAKTLMDAGKVIIFEGDSTASMPEYVSWTNYSGNIYYTDAFVGSKTPMVTCGTIGAVLNTLRKTSLAQVTGVNQFYHDLTTGRFYSYFTSAPATINTRNYQGIEKFDFFSLCMYYCFGFHTNGYFYLHNWNQGNYNQTVPGYTTWFDAMGYDIGAPTAGGVRSSDGGYTADLWGVSTETSSDGYVFWIHPTSSIRKVYARKFGNAYTLFRPSAQSMAECGTDPQLVNVPFRFRKLRGDGTLDDPVEANIGITMVNGEGAILVTDTEPVPTGQKYLIGIFK